MGLISKATSLFEVAQKILKKSNDPTFNVGIPGARWAAARSTEVKGTEDL